MQRSRPLASLPFSAALLCLTLAACGSDDAKTSTPTDAGAAADVATTDVGAADTGAADTGVSDGGAVDSGAEDDGAASDATGTVSKYNDFASALAVSMNDKPTQESLTPTGESDFYKFEGKKGDPLLILVHTKKATPASAAVDPVVTLYGPDKKPFAFNNDSYKPFSTNAVLSVIAPKDGTYYIKVQECWTWREETKTSGSCAAPKDKTKPNYFVSLYKHNVAHPHIVQEEEKGNTAADASIIGYTKSSGSAYYLGWVFGTLTGTDDMDWFTFKIPTNVAAAGKLVAANFTPMHHGVDGNGSTTSLGAAALYLASAPTVVVASADFANKGTEIRAPVTPGETYLLSVKHPGTVAGSHDFYFMRHTPAPDQGAEAADTINNDLATPEPMALGSYQQPRVAYYFVSGTIASASDLDHFSIAVVTGMENGKISVDCAAERAGSGLRGLGVSLMKKDGTQLTGGGITESATNAAELSGLAVGGESKLVLKLKADKQDPAVSSTFYRCAVQIEI